MEACQHMPTLACCCRLQVGMFALGAWQACGIVLFSALQHTSSAQWRGTYRRLPLAGRVPANGVAATAVAGALCATWAVWHNAVWSWPLQVRAWRWAGLGQLLPPYACA